MKGCLHLGLFISGPLNESYKCNEACSEASLSCCWKKDEEMCVGLETVSSKNSRCKVLSLRWMTSWVSLDQEMLGCCGEGGGDVVCC